MLDELSETAVADLLRTLAGFFLDGNGDSSHLSQHFRTLLSPFDAAIPTKPFEIWHSCLQEAFELTAHRPVSSDLNNTNVGNRDPASNATQDSLGNDDAHKQVVERLLGSQGRITVDKFLVSLGNAIVDHARAHDMTLWDRATCLITIEVLAFAFGSSWPPNIWEYVAPESEQELGSRISPILKVLDRLYAGPAQKPIAGPLHFYHLASACKFLPAVVDRAKRAALGRYKLDEYFNALELTVNPHLRIRNYHLVGLPTGEEEDWCFRYLAEKISKHKPFNIVVPPARFLQEDSPWSRWDSWMSQIFRGKPKNYNVAIVGSGFSGRQTILDLLKIAIWDGVALGPALAFHAESPLNGAVTLPGGKTGKIVVFGPKVSTEPPKGNVGVSGFIECSTIIFTIPARVFSNSAGKAQNEVQSEEGRKIVEDLNDALRLLQLGKQGRGRAERRYSIAFAYTMSDEFGIVLPNRLRLIEEASDWQAFVDFSTTVQDRGRANEHEEAWKVFTNHVSMRKDTPKDLVVLKRMLLNGTRTLWQAIARDFDKGHAVVNGYLVQARTTKDEPAGDRNWEAAGCLQIFSDMFFETPV